MILRLLRAAALCAGVAVAAIGATAVPEAMVVGVIGAVMIGLSVYQRVRQDAAGDAAATATAGRRGGLVAGCVVLVGWSGLVGSVVLIGPAAAVLLVVVSVIAGALLWWRRDAAGAHPDPWRAARSRLLSVAQPQEARTPDPTPPPTPSGMQPASEPAMADMSIAQLCLAWQHSYFALLDLPAEELHADLVRLRIGLLDEFERRDPAGFTRWMDAGARAGSNPRLDAGGDG